MALPVNGSTHLIPAYNSFYRPRKDERLSWPSWLTFSGWLTHISGHPSAAGRAQDRESSPARDRRSTTEPRHQLIVTDRNSVVFSSHLLCQKRRRAIVSAIAIFIFGEKFTDVRPNTVWTAIVAVDVFQVWVLLRYNPLFLFSLFRCYGCTAHAAMDVESVTRVNMKHVGNESVPKIITNDTKICS